MPLHQKEVRRNLTPLWMLCIVLCLLMVPALSCAATRNVGTFAELNAAISASASGDTIALPGNMTLGAGEYIALTGKTLTLTSANPAAPVTITRSSALNNAPMIYMADGTADITIRSLTLDGGAVWDKHGSGAVNTGLCNGGGIYMRAYSTTYPGSLAMTGGSITGNTTLGGQLRRRLCGRLVS